MIGKGERGPGSHKKTSFPLAVCMENRNHSIGKSKPMEKNRPWQEKKRFV
jgi:hypothetical protein